MSRSYDKRKKMKRRALFDLCPELRILHNAIRRGVGSPWRFARDERGGIIMRWVHNIRPQKGVPSKVYRKRWPIISVRGEEKLKALYELGKARAEMKAQ